MLSTLRTTRTRCNEYEENGEEATFGLILEALTLTLVGGVQSGQRGEDYFEREGRRFALYLISPSPSPLYVRHAGYSDVKFTRTNYKTASQGPGPQTKQTNGDLALILLYRLAKNDTSMSLFSMAPTHLAEHPGNVS